MRKPVFASLLLAAALAPSTATADPVVTVGAGGGHLGCSTADGDCAGQGPVQAGSFTAGAGGHLDRDVELLGMLTVAAHSDDQSTVSQWVVAPVLRAWLIPHLWMEGGLGVAHTQVETMSGGVTAVARSSDAPAVLGAVGVDVLTAPTFALDVDLRGARAFYDNDVHVYQATLGVGLTL